MKVVLDTNIFCADYRLGGGAFRVFLDALVRIGAVCCVPEVVRDEIVVTYRRRLEDVAASVRKASQSWRRLTGRSLSVAPPETDLAGCEAEYGLFLAQLFQNHGIVVLPYPEVSHQTLVDRALKRRRPFSESGSGYRDSLIWATVVALRRSAQGPVVFVSNNSKDFGTAPALHPDLAADIEAGTTIELYNTLEQFNAARVVPHLEHLENVLRELQEDHHAKFSLGEWIDRELKDVLNRDGDGCHFIGLEPDHGSVWVSSIKERGRVIVDDVRLLPSGDLIVLANVDLKLELSVSADWDDCDRYRDVREFFGGDCSGSPTAWVEEKGNVAFTLTLKRESFQVDWCDLDEIQGICDVEINPHPRRDA